MAITDADIVFRASERMTDFADGGGRMSDVVVVSGQDNNVWPDVTDIERLTGKVSLRKIYGAVLSDDNDTFLSSHVLLDQPASDPATSVVLFSTGGIGTTRQEAQAAIEASAQNAFASLLDLYTLNSGGPSQSTQNVQYTQFNWSSGSLVLSKTITLQPGSEPTPEGGGFVFPAASIELQRIPAGTVLAMNLNGELYYTQLTADRPAGFFSGPPSGADPATVTITFNVSQLPPTGGNAFLNALGPVLAQAPNTVAVFGVCTAPSSTAAGATAVQVDSTFVAVDPRLSVARLRVINTGNAVLVHHTQAEVPQTVANAQTVSTGRVALARLRVIGSTGVEHFRATRGQASTGGGATANLDTGEITFTDVAGLAQPVTIEHRIEEMALAATVTITSVTINRPLSRAYPAGTRVSSLLMRGDLQARSGAGFPQQAWLGQWVDTPVGGTPVGDYNAASHPIACTNRGAVTERWAIIFTNTTSFRCIGESLGEVGTGSTGAPFAPINPATGVPYFTIPAAGWGAGWASGNVYRFPTTGAATPIWCLRCVAPSLPAGDDQATVQLRGYINN